MLIRRDGRRRGRFELAAGAFLVATAATAFALRNGWTGECLPAFAAAGRTMLSGAWRHTFHDPFFQTGPLELAAATLVEWLGGSSRGLLAIVCAMTVAAPIVAVARTLVGRRALPLLVAGTGAVALGVVTTPYVHGHFAEAANGILWLLAARAARRDRTVLAGLLVGASAGFELWGLLGVTVLLLAPDLRRAATGAGVAAATTLALFGPFVLGGDFHMFAWRWHVTGGLMGALLGDGHPFGWSLRVLQGATTVAVAGTFARLSRRSPVSIYAVPFATAMCRLLLDPMSISYYYDVATEIALIGAAALLAARVEMRAWLEPYAAALGGLRPSGGIADS
jgi:hypothetical protein